jgi:hypothetical protein
MDATPDRKFTKETIDKTEDTATANPIIALMGIMIASGIIAIKIPATTSPTPTTGA